MVGYNADPNYREPVKTKAFPVNSEVQWKWAGGVVEGKVKEIFFEPTTQLIKGKSIKRNGSPENQLTWSNRWPVI